MMELNKNKSSKQVYDKVPLKSIYFDSNVNK